MADVYDIKIPSLAPQDEFTTVDGKQVKVVRPGEMKEEPEPSIHHHNNLDQPSIDLTREVIGAIQHSDLSGVTADQHHAKTHAASHTSGGADDLTGITLASVIINSGTLVSPVIGTPAITGGTITSISLVTPTVGTPTVTGGTLTNVTANTLTIPTGGWVGMGTAGLRWVFNGPSSSIDFEGGTQVDLQGADLVDVGNLHVEHGGLYVTGGTITSGTLVTPTIGTMTATGGTATNLTLVTPTIGTPTITGGTASFDRVSIGGTVHEALLQLAAGGTAAYSAPLKFVSGTLNTTPESGAMEFYDGRWYLTGSHKQRVIDRTGDVITANVDAVGTAQTTLYSATLSKAAAKVGRIYKIHCDGVIKNNQTTDDPTFYFYRDAVALATLTVVGGAYPANTSWHFESIQTVRAIGSSGTAALHVDISIGNGLGWSETSTVLTGIDFTLDRTLTIKAKWSDNDDQTLNVITAYQGFLELKN